MECRRFCVADVSIDISALDRGGRALIAGITQALRALRSEQAKQAEQSRNQAAQARTVSNSLQAQSNIYKQLAADERANLRATTEASNARIAQIRKERDEELAAVKAINRGRLESARGLAQMKREALDVAKTTRQQVQVGKQLVTLPVDQSQVAAKRRELAEANAGIARAKAINQQEIANVRKAAAAEEEASRRTVAAQRRKTQAREEQARNAQKNARLAETTSRQEERAAQRAAAALERQSKAMQTVSNAGSQLRNTILRLVAAYSGLRAIEGFIAAGLRFNQIIESSRLGIGALITAEADLFDQQGRQLTGTVALSAAQGLAADQLDKLRVAGIQTAATTEALVTSFEEAVGAGLAVGLTLDQIRKFTVSIAQAASAIHLPMNQLQQETRSILQGTIDRNSRIAKALQLTNEEVRLAKEQGRLAQLLEERFKAFNLAGIESVKTFGALKSNIEDAFSVFAGRATEPLFRQIRDAGVSALSSIFDFRSADIARSFQGLVQGLQVIFNQIGGLLADAIRGAVQKAQDLSKWFSENREEVKKTAAAIRTMVEDFGRMVSAIVSSVAAVGSLGSQTNTVIGAARVLSAVFQSIADNVGLIVSLLTARALIGALMNIAAIFTAVSSGAAATSVGGPIAGLIAAILTLGAGYKLLTGFEKELRLETGRTTTALEDQALSATDLFKSILSLERELQQKGITAEETANLEAQLADKFSQVAALGPDYANAIGLGTDALDKRKKGLLELIKAQAAQLAFQAAAALVELNSLRARREELRQQQAEASAGFKGKVLDFVLGAKNKTDLEDLDNLIASADAKSKNFNETLIKLNQTLIAAFTVPARIKGHGGAGTGVGGDINDAVQRAQAELQRVKDLNEARLNLIQAQFKTGAKTAIDVIKAQRDAAIAEMDAEQKVLEAQRDAAARRVIKGKVVPDQGQIDATKIKLDGLEARRKLLDAQTNEDIENARRDHQEQLNKIEEDFLRANGDRLSAIRLEIERKHEKELQAAIREFGPNSVQVVQIKFAINQQSIEEQAKAIEGQIREIEDSAQREIETARLRILGPDKAVGGGNAQQKQQIAHEIAAANQRAIERTIALRGALIDLRDQATDPLLASFIQSLIDQLDQLKAKSKEVDESMRKLKEGVAEAFVSGLSDFFDSFTDKTKTLAQSFKDMVRSILSDISRLVSRLLAEKIVFGIAGLFSGGGQVGNQTQAQGRAAGGLGRPPHGQLKGGFPGTDSIHIAAMPEEYFVQVPAVRYYGTEFMDAVNKMQLPRVNPRSFKPLALGGGAMEPANATARPSTRQDVHHHIGVDEDGLLRVLAWPSWSRGCARPDSEESSRSFWGCESGAEASVTEIFTPEINWLNPLVEEHEFETPIFVSHDGSEQRQSLMNVPHRRLTYNISALDYREAARLEGLIRRVQGEPCYVPYWRGARYVTNIVGNVIFTDTLFAGFEIDNWAILIRDAHTVGVAKITNVQPNSVTLAAAIPGTWPFNRTKIVPTFLGQLST